jgi:hypothetical protein
MAPAFVREAEVVQPLTAQLLRVRVTGRDPMEVTARVAMPGSPTLRPGDRVLVVGESPASGFIIGLLQAESPRSICTVEGAGARIEVEGPERRIAVHDSEDRVLFEYHPQTRRSVLRVPVGDLEIAAPDGRIDLTAARGIACTTPGEVLLRGTKGVNIGVPGLEGVADQTLLIDSQSARLSLNRLDITAERCDARMVEADFSAKSLRGTVSSAKLVCDKLETTAQRLWERSGQAIRQVKDLCQVTAGRMRTLVRGAHDIQSERTTITARDEVRMNGDRINLG